MSTNKEIDSAAGSSSVAPSEPDTVICDVEGDSSDEDDDDKETGTYFIDHSGYFYYQATKESKPVWIAQIDSEKEMKDKKKQKELSGNQDYVTIMPSDGNSGEVNDEMLEEGKNQVNTSGEADADKNGENEEDPNTKTASYLCNQCNYTSTKRYLLTHHMKSHSDERPHKCSVCERGFKWMTSLHNHVNTHTGTKPHHCKFCMSSFTTSWGLLRHVRYRHTHEKPHKCSECDYASVELSKLKRHIRSHTGERPYQCPHCMYASPDTFKLKRHLRIHTGEKPYECDVCNAKFTRSNSLKAHKLIHNVGNKPVFQCELCPTTCDRKRDIRIHIQKLHMPYKPLKCKRCNGLFPDRNTYKIHMNTHKGEKCYKCDLCPYASISARHLESHTLIHTDQKPYQCDQCDQSFRQKQILKRHGNHYHKPDNMTPLPNPKDNHCLHCNRSFRYKSNLIRHLALHVSTSSVHEDAQAIQGGTQEAHHLGG